MSLGGLALADGLVAVPLALAVLCAWVGALAAWRLPTALDRMHAVAFVNAAAGGFLTLAGFAADGVSPRSVKILALWLVLLAVGAGLSHATGRAVLVRGGRGA